MLIEINKEVRTHKKPVCKKCKTSIECGEVSVCVQENSTRSYRRLCEFCSEQHLKAQLEEMNLLYKEFKEKKKFVKRRNRLAL